MAETYPHNGDGHRHVSMPVEDQPLGDLFQDLAHEASDLLRLELDLAKTEMSQKASQAGKDIGFLVAGGFVLYAGFLAIVAAVVVGLANFIPPWLSALIIGIIIAVVGYALIRKGMGDLKHRSLAPERTLATLKDDRQQLAQKQVT